MKDLFSHKADYIQLGKLSIQAHRYRLFLSRGIQN